MLISSCCGRASAVDTDVAVYMGLMQEEIDQRGAQECLDLQGQLFTRLQDPVRQRAVINLDGKPLHSVSPEMSCDFIPYDMRMPRMITCLQTSSQRLFRTAASMSPLLTDEVPYPANSNICSKLSHQAC